MAFGFCDSTYVPSQRTRFRRPMEQQLQVVSKVGALMWIFPLIFWLVALSLMGRRRASEKQVLALPQAPGVPITMSVESWRALAASVGGPFGIPTPITLAW